MFAAIFSPTVSVHCQSRLNVQHPTSVKRLSHGRHLRSGHVYKVLQHPTTTAHLNLNSRLPPSPDADKSKRRPSFKFTGYPRRSYLLRWPPKKIRVCLTSFRLLAPVRTPNSCLRSFFVKPNFDENLGSIFNQKHPLRLMKVRS